MPKHPNENCMVVYGRVSTDDQTTNTSLPGQEESGKQYAERNGLKIVGHCVDEGVGGKKYWTRHGIQQALKMLEAQEARILF